jgi:hypothetical protein
MANDTISRFEIKLLVARRLELDQLAHESGISSAALAKLAIVAMLEQRTVRLPAWRRGHERDGVWTGRPCCHLLKGGRRSPGSRNRRFGRSRGRRHPDGLSGRGSQRCRE